MKLHCVHYLNPVTNTDPNESASDNEVSDGDGNEDSAGRAEPTSCSKRSQQAQEAVHGKRPQVVRYCMAVCGTD